MDESTSLLEAQEFRVIDTAGRTRARLGMIEPNGETVGFELLRADGSVGVQIELQVEPREYEFGTGIAEYPQVRLMDSDGVARVTANIGEGEGSEYSGLSINGEDGEARLTLVVPPGDYGEISLSGKHSPATWALRSFETSFGSIMRTLRTMETRIKELERNRDMDSGIQNPVDNIADYLFERIKTVRIKPGRLANVLSQLVWMMDDQGTEIMTAIEQWIQSNDIYRVREGLLIEGIFPFAESAEMEAVLTRVKAQYPWLAARCDELVAKRRIYPMPKPADDA